MSLTKRWMEESNWDYEFQYDDYYDDDYYTPEEKENFSDWEDYKALLQN